MDKFNISIWKPSVKSHKQHLCSFLASQSISLQITLEIIYQVLTRINPTGSIQAIDHVNMYRDVILHKRILSYLAKHDVRYTELPLSATAYQEKLYTIGRISAQDKLPAKSQNLKDLRVLPKDNMQLYDYMKKFFFESMCIVHSSDGKFPDHKTLAERVNLGGLLPIDIDVNWLLYHWHHEDEVSLSLSKTLDLNLMFDTFSTVVSEHNYELAIEDHIVDWHEWYDRYSISDKVK